MMRDLTGIAKSCPMCGSNRIYMEEPDYDVIFSVKIQCADCGLLGFKNYHKSAKNPIEKTIEYWNTRATENEQMERKCNYDKNRYHQKNG